MKEFSGKRILVVGGAGFVGSNLVRALLESGPAEILVIDNLLSSERENLPNDPKIKLIVGSITDDSLLINLQDNLDYVFHLATFHGNRNSLNDPLADHQNNTLTTLKLFERIKSFKKIKKIVYSSAGCTIAEKTWSDAKPITEDAPVSLHLDSPYQISKLIGELYGNYYFHQHQLPVVKARFQNVYGPGEVLGSGRWRGTIETIYRNVVPTFIYHAINQKPLPVENEGKASRDFIYVTDIAHGLMLCAAKGEPGGVYNLASGVETSILELAKTINTLTGNTSPIAFAPKRTWDRSGRRVGSTEKSKRELGFEAKVELNYGLAKTVDWTRENFKRIEACIHQHQQHLPKI